VAPSEAPPVALTPAQAAIVRLSAAIAAGVPEDVARRAEGALQAGATPAQVYETVLQSYLFVGFPRAIEAFFAVRPILEDRGGTPAEATPPDPAAWERAGRDLCRRVYGANYERLLETMRSLSPDLGAWMISEGYGKTLSRPGLDPVEREYAVVAILTVGQMWRQLRSHAIGAVNVGGTRAGVRDAIVLCRHWRSDAVIADALAVTGLE
jgi:4-carboxymuconolactone decarboxylase